MTSTTTLTGLSAFPLTPLSGDVEHRVDERAFTGLVRRLAEAGVDSIGALGSTGAAVYLDRAERRRLLELAVEAAGDVPVIAGVSALSTRDVLRHAEDAERAGAAALLLAPVSYTPLTEAEALGLYTDVSGHTGLPVVVYDNPVTTRFAFTDELYVRLTDLTGIASIKIPGVPADPVRARARIDRLRSVLPPHVTIGVSGDPLAAAGLAAGCDGWYSAIGGTLPDLARRIASTAHDPVVSSELDARLRPLWELFAAHGSLRVIAAIAERLGLAGTDCLPRPLRGLDPPELARLDETLERLADLAGR